MTSRHRTSSPTEPVRNSLCRALGHEWAKTTADNYRRCQRSQCHAAQRFIGTRWVTVSARRPAQPSVQPQQAALWPADRLSRLSELS